MLHFIKEKSKKYQMCCDVVVLITYSIVVVKMMLNFIKYAIEFVTMVLDVINIRI